MADATKAQKLAAARKKLKEYQQKTKKQSDNEDSVAAVETLSTSTHSSFNGNFDNEAANDATVSEHMQISPFHNYFSNNQVEVCQNSTNFFDNITSDSEVKPDNFQKNDVQQSFSYNYNYEPNVESEDSVTLDYPEFKQNNLFNYFAKNEEPEHPSVSSEDAKKLSEYMGSQQQEDEIRSNEAKNAVCLHDGSNLIPLETSCLAPANLEKPLNSNAESLRQLSSQISELIKNETVSPQPISSLEQRNQELAALLQNEQIESQKLQVQLQDYKNRITQLESENQQVKVDYEHRINRELGPLQEQLQCHAQTIGILVGEKTELSSSLNQNQFVMKQKLMECEELQGRLKTSRSRVADLEKELNTLKSEGIKSECQALYEEEITKLKRDIEILKQQKEETNQDMLELREKLNAKVNETVSYQREVQELSHQLSLAQVKIEQLTAGESLQYESQVESLTQQKLILEKQVTELTHALKATGEERDQASVQYQNYVQQLNSQVTTVGSKLETLMIENENLAAREQSLVKHIGELEKHLQNLQDDRFNIATRESSTDLRKELESTQESLRTLESLNSKLEENYREIVSERDELFNEIAGKKELLEQLEEQIERLQGNQPDSAKLLAAMESDKIAAARAVTQNSQLKQELEEIQQAFVKMSNDKLELTDKLSSSEFKTKELAERVIQVESQLQMLSDAVEIKDKELTRMRDKQIKHHDHSDDHSKHRDTHDTSSHSLQVELQKAQDHILQLTKENTKLKRDICVTEHAGNNEPVELDNRVTYNHTNGSAIDVESQTIDGQLANLDLNILDKEVAMKHLEDKFSHTMNGIANLTEEKQRLEHIVMQLQGETETIGEYIALYQHQRGILKQRTQEKDEQLKRLAEDREKVRIKLDMLNGLVRKLVLEKGVLTPEVIEQHQNNQHDFCTEHVKLRQEMHKSSSLNSTTHQAQVTENNNLSTETAEEIISLLSEIKNSNLIQPSDNFHPCPWCSGQLITV